MRAFPKYSNYKVRNGVRFARQLQDTHVFSKTRKAFALLPYKDLMIRMASTPPLTIAVVGENLLTDHHAEFSRGSSGPTEIERSVYGKVIWRW
jgi:hypothetical protein